MVSALAALVVLIPFIASLYPVPPYPQSILIYVFAGLLAIGFGWFLFLKSRRPSIVVEIQGHLAETYERFSVERAAATGAVK